LEKKSAKKRPNISGITIFKFFYCRDLFKKMLWAKIVGGRVGWSVLICINVEKLFYLLENNFQKSFYLSWWEKLSNYVLPCLEECFSATLSFDLWMSKGTMDIFGQGSNWIVMKT